MNPPNPPADVPPPESLGWKTLAFVALFYPACLAVATYPRVFQLGTTLPALADPVQHLTVLRWYRDCVVAGRSPLLLNGLQYPFGAPLGNFSPMQFQALLFTPLSLLISNEILCYNLLWIFAFLLAGFAAFGLAWRASGDRSGACLAGLLAMLSGPMMLHGHGHLELMYVGLFPPFLMAWMRFVDEPRGGRLIGAAGLYLLMVAGAAYFAVLATVPAVVYVIQAALREGRAGRAAWLRRRVAWLTGFAALAVPGLAALFAAQLRGAARGDDMARPLLDYARYGVPAWSYVAPTYLHGLHRLLGLGDMGATDSSAAECGSYLGLVTLGLLAYAAVARVRFRDAAFWWSTLAVLVVLSFGAYMNVGGWRIGMPGLWLWKLVPIFRLIRAPARFNLLAVMCAAVIAAAALRSLTARLPGPKSRAAAFAALAALAVADLATVPFEPCALPAMPAAYGVVKQRGEGTALLEIPLEVSGHARVLNAMSGYWQAAHGLRTTGGYSGLTNATFDHQLVHNTPFSYDAMAEPAYLADPDSADFGIVKEVGFRDYAWLYLNTLGLDYVVLHEWPGAVPAAAPGMDRLKAQLAGARVFEDGATALYDRRRVEPPTRPVLVCTDGWRGGWHGHDCLVVPKAAGVAAYSPDPQDSLTFALDARAVGQPQVVRLRDGDAELARWTIGVDQVRRYETPPFRLSPGVHHLRLECQAAAGTPAPAKPLGYDLSVRSLRLRPAEPNLVRGGASAAPIPPRR